MFIWDGKGHVFALANKNEIARLEKSLMESFFKGKCALRKKYLRNNLMEYADMRLPIDLKSEIANAI